MDPITQNDTQLLSATSGSGTEALSSAPLPSYPNDVSDPIADPIPTEYLGISSYWHDTLTWDNLLKDGRVRPFVDFGLHPSGGLTRVPVVASDYNVYADNALFYEDVEIKGQLKGDLAISGIMSSRKSIEIVSDDKTISYGDLGKILHIEPTSSSVKITLPVLDADQKGFFVEAVNTLEGKFTEFSVEVGELKAKGSGLSQAYSAATIYWTGEHWFAIGDLTPVA